MEFDEDEYLQLAGIQHFTFCRRQWAIIHIEQQWDENLLTMQGQIMHKRAHDNQIVEKRGNLLVSRGMAVASSRLGISGQCDVVEFRRGSSGIPIHNREGLFEVVPVEYKRGSAKVGEEDILQLTAQAICLEEMLCCTIDKGYLYYGEERHRTEVAITDDYRRKVEVAFSEMHQMYRRRYTPKVRRTKACYSCSVKEICLPSLCKTTSVDHYIDSHINDESQD